MPTENFADLRIDRSRSTYTTPGDRWNGLSWQVAKGVWLGLVLFALTGVIVSFLGSLLLIGSLAATIDSLSGHHVSLARPQAQSRPQISQYPSYSSAITPAPQPQAAPRTLNKNERCIAGAIVEKEADGSYVQTGSGC